MKPPVYEKNHSKAHEVKHKIFPWGLTAAGSTKTLQDVESFINEIGADNVISVTSVWFGIIVWYKVGKSTISFK